MLWIMLWESVNDPWVRARIRRALGFCPRHTLRLCQVANAEGLGVIGPAIIFADIIAAIRMLLQTDKSHLAPAALCPGCVHEQQTARGALYGFLQHLNHPSLNPLIQQHGFCQTHYRMGLTLRGPRGAQASLQSYQQAHLAQRAARLGEGSPRALAQTSAAILRGGSPWPPARARGAASLRRSTAQQAAYSVETLRADVSCPICTGAAERSTTQQQAWLTALLVEGPQRAAFVAAGGVCMAHAGVLDGLPAESVREIYGATWGAAEAALALVPTRVRSWRDGWRALGMSQPPCPICAEVERAAHATAECLVADPASEEAAYCLPHLRLLLQAAPPERGLLLCARQASRLRTLEAELGELVRKSDWQYRDEPRGSEQRAWARAAAFFIGPLLLRESA